MVDMTIVAATVVIVTVNKVDDFLCAGKVGNLSRITKQLPFVTSFLSPSPRSTTLQSFVPLLLLLLLLLLFVMGRFGDGLEG